MKIFTYIKKNSKRIENKNFRNLGGIPVWKNLIYELSSIAQVYIDTDSEEVISECRSDPNLKKVTAYARKRQYIEMENDPNNKISPALLMLENFLDEYVDDVDETIVLTHVTSPFLTKETVADAVNIYESSKYDFVHSVNEKYDFAWLKDFSKPINFNPNVVQRTQDLDPIYFSNGAFFIMNKRIFKRYNNRIGDNIYFYPLDHVEGIELDYEKDFEFAKIVLRGRNK